ncbi:MAG: stage V sporulation protein AD [Lachnospiraceae bacterium]|nr:stage V sporulation protein AD [Lachnospiraceae bacterium]
MIGNQSIQFENPPYLINSGSIVGSKEGQGPMGKLFDKVGEDDMFGAQTWEEAESTLQKEALQIALNKENMKKEELNLLFAGDLLGQSIASSFGISSFHTPHVGLYGACSTCGLSIAVGSMAVAGGFADKVACVTSSHFASAEKEFRFPLAYGNQRPLSATWTVTGSGAFLLSSKPNRKVRAVVSGVTFGKIMDYGVKDSMNMGACMAPAAADTIKQHLQDFGRKPEAYDKIITGDLGAVGQKLLFELLQEDGIDIQKQHMDCGMEIFDSEKQNTNAGGSGCGCAAVILSAYILKKIEEGVWERVLFLPTGALLSKTSFNEGQTIPGISHAVVLEHYKNS